MPFAAARSYMIDPQETSRPVAIVRLKLLGKKAARARSL